jgi:alpha-L-rhamnosidase
MVVQTFRNNLLHGIPLSNTNSEKYGWTGDVHLFSEAASYSFETASFWTKWLNDFPDNQKWNGNDGKISVVVPELRDKKVFINDVSWLAVYPRLLEEMLKSNHDKQIVKKHFPSLKKWYDYVYNHTDDGIASGVWGDHKIPGENKESLGATRSMARLINTSYLYKVSMIMAELAQAIDEDSSNYLLKAEKIKTIFHKKFYLLENGYFMENTSPEYFNYELAANLIALQCGIVADSLTGRISEFVQSQITNNNYRVPTGILGTKAFIDWFQKKDVDMLYKIIKQKDFPGYIYMLELGATTLNQEWTGAGDYNHCMLGCVNEFFYNNLLGIQPDIENRKIVIEPFIPDDLSFANGGIQTIYGEVSVNWKKEDEKLILNAEIPANTNAVFKMPITKNSRITVNGKESAGTFETGSGKYVIATN